MNRWLTDDPVVLNALLLVAASSLAVALTSCLWNHIYHNDVPAIQTQQPVQEQKETKSTRSKERRRRGKDPFRDLLKGGKKSRALLRAIKVPDHDTTPPSPDTLSNPSIHSASSTSRSDSPEPAGDLVDTDQLVSHPDVKSDDAIPNGDSSVVASTGNLSDHGTSGVCSHADHIRSHSCTPDSMTAMDTQANVSSASTIIGHVSELAPSSPPVPTLYVTPSRDIQTASTSDVDKPACSRTRLPESKIDPGVQSVVDSVEISFPSIYPTVPYSSLSKAASTNLSADGAGSSTPTNCGESSEYPFSAQHLDPDTQLASLRDALEAAQLREEQLRVEAEQASKERDELCWRWNEDAGIWRRREAELQTQIHHLMQQVQAYATAASFPPSGFSSPTSPHSHSSPLLQHPALAPFPLPPAIQTQNSASPPAHVQALLACAPMLTSQLPGFTAPIPGGYPGVGHGMSPLLWPGIGLSAPNRDARHGGRWTPDSSTSGSWSRGRRRRRTEVKSASDESSLDGVDGSDEDAWEEEIEEDEDEFRNNALADAILKRPESIRDLSILRKRPGVRGVNPPTNPVVDGAAAQ